MEKHPSRPRAATSAFYRPSVGLGFFYRFKLVIARPLAIILIAIIGFGGWTALAAENALPGEPLYLVKLNLNENVPGLFAFSGESKARWNEWIVSRRLEEAEKLAIQSKINPRILAKIEDSLKEHADKAGLKLSQYKNKGAGKAAKISSSFETTLDAHGKILKKIAENKNGAVGQDISSLLNKVRDKKQDFEEKRNDEEDEILERPTDSKLSAAANERLQAAEARLREAQLLIENGTKHYGAEAMSRAEDNFSMAETAIAAGRSKLQSGEYNEAFLLFQEANRGLQTTVLVLKARIDLGIKDQLVSD